MKTFVITLLCAFMLVLPMWGQVKKPTIMVIPTNPWCEENQCMITAESQGSKKQYPDYAKAVNNSDLLNVITKIGELMTEREFPLKDLSSTIRSVDQASVEDEMISSSTLGASIAENPLDRVMNRAKADILIEVGWKINTVGPKHSITYTLRGLDAYTNKQVAAAQGTGEPSFSAEVPALLEEAVIANMDNFASQLLGHFSDLQTNGREVFIDIRTFDNGSDITLESEYNGKELQEIIDNWMAENTVNHRYNLTDATENRMTFEQVRIPLFKENKMPMDTRSFVMELRKTLRATPYNIPSKVITRGLGRATLIIGEK